MGEISSSVMASLALSLSCLCVLMATATLATPTGHRRAVFFNEQRAGKVEYIGWPPIGCTTDADCKGVNGSYCMNDKTKTAPFFCHEPIVTLNSGLARPTGLTVDSDAGKVFYTEDDQSSGDTQWPLSVINIDGTNKSVVLPKLLDPQGLDCDTKAKKVYYTEHHGQRVGVVNYDGTGQKVLHTFSGDAIFPSDIVVDSVNGYLFVQVETSLSTGGQLVRMGLDGSNATAIVKDITRAYGIAVDAKSKTAFYVSGGHGGFISSVSYDGTKAKSVLEGLEWPFEIAVDVPNQRLVFTTTGVGDGRVTTSLFNGSDIQVVDELGFAPMGVNFGLVPISKDTPAVSLNAGPSPAPWKPPTVKCPDTPANYCDCGGGDHGYLWYCRANNGLVWETNDKVPVNPCPCKYPQCTTHPDLSRSSWLVKHLNRER